MRGVRTASGGARAALLATVLSLVTAAGAAGATGWQPPVALSEAGLHAIEPRVAVSPGGEAVAVWSLFASGYRGVQAAARPTGGAWSVPSTLAFVADLEDEAGPANVAVDAAGNAVAGWGERVNSDGSLRAAVRPVGGAWSAPETVSGVQATPTLGTDAAGNAIALWITDNVRVAVRPVGGVWSAPETLPGSSPPATFPAGVRIAVTPSGTIVAAWSLLTNAGPPAGAAPAGFQVAVRPAGGAWGAPERLSEVGSNPEVAVDPAGNAVVVWAEAGIRAATRPAGGAWSAFQTLAEAGTVPDVALEGGGNAVAVWHRPFFTVDPNSGVVTNLFRIEAATRPAGGAWSAPSILSEPAPLVSGAQVGVNAGGDAVAVWHRTIDAIERVEAAVRPPGGPWSTAQALSDPSRRAFGAQVAVDASGDAVAAWQEAEAPGDADFRIQAASYEADPRPPGPAKGTPRCLPAPAAPTPPAGSPGRVELSAAQLRINQRIGQAAIRRLNAVEDWLAAGILTRDLCGGAIGAARFAPTIVTVLAPASLAAATLPDPRPLVVAPASPSGNPVRLSVAQLLINQRIYQAAIRRAAALERRLSGRLTGGDLTAGALTQDKLAERLQVVRATPSPDPVPSGTEIAPPGSGGKALTLSAEQLRINQRIAQAAVRRANALTAHLRSGLDGDEFAPATITARALAAGVVKP
jgi:hypothetical protein